MKIAISLSILFFALVARSQQIFLPGTNICSNEDWKLVFYDDFEGNEIDQSKWYTYGAKWEDNSDEWEFGRTHGDEGQIYFDENVVVNNGILKLVAKEETATWYTATRDYTSGWIETKIQNFKFGRFEAKYKVPKGMGFWPAFWLWGGDEIDIFEFGGQNPNEFYTNIHACYGNPSCNQSASHTGTDYSLDFHTYAIEWDLAYLRWYVDGELIRTNARYMTVSGEHVVGCDLATGTYFIDGLYPTDPMRVILNLAIGTPNTPFTSSPNENTILPNQLEVDYVAIYQRSPQEGLQDLCDRKIIGQQEICDSELITYSITGADQTTVQNWTVSQNLQIVSQTSSSIIVVVDEFESSQAWVKATFPSNIPCEQNEVKKIISIGIPEVTDVFGPKYFRCAEGALHATTTHPGFSLQYEWGIYASALHFPYGIEAPQVYVTPNTSNDFFTIECRAKNSCGWSEWFDKSFDIDCDPNDSRVWTLPFSALRVNPNPTYEKFKIDVNENERSVMFNSGFLLSEMTGKVYQIEIEDGNVILDRNQIPSGVYRVLVNFNSGKTDYSHPFLIK